MRRLKAAAFAMAAFGAVMSAVPTVSSAQDGAVKIGVLDDMSGPYLDNTGPGDLLAVRVAVADLGGTVLGKPIEMISADMQNKVAEMMCTSLRRLRGRPPIVTVVRRSSSSTPYAGAAAHMALGIGEPMRPAVGAEHRGEAVGLGADPLPDQLAPLAQDTDLAFLLVHVDANVIASRALER